MENLFYMISSTVVVLGLLIFVHELGHFVLAKLFGVGVQTFSFGFGPRLIGKTVGETDYRVSLVPLGGYVRMIGENPRDEVGEEDADRAFFHKGVGKRFLIVFAGPFSNFLFAAFLFFLMAWTAGLASSTTQVGRVQDGFPAKEAGIQPGDVILSVNDVPVQKWEDMASLIRDGGGKPVRVLVQRGEERFHRTIQPKIDYVQTILGDKKTVPLIGISPGNELIWERVGFFSAIVHGFVNTYWVTEVTVLSVVRLIQRKLPAESVVGGPILIAQLAGQKARQGLLSLVYFMGVLSVSLGILNLLPVPVLDGGHLFFFTLEMVFRKPISIRMREIAQQVGFVLLVLLMVLVFYNDIARLITR